MAYAEFPDNDDAPLHRIALGDAAEIDAHTLFCKANRAVNLVGFNEAVVQPRQFLRDRILVGPATFPEIVMLADAVVGDIERTTGQHRDIQ